MAQRLLVPPISYLIITRLFEKFGLHGSGARRLYTRAPGVGRPKSEHTPRVAMATAMALLVAVVHAHVHVPAYRASGEDDTSTGYCNRLLQPVRTQTDPNMSCQVDDKGTFPLRAEKGSMTWETVRDSCRRMCAACARCNYISVSLRFRDCSWFHACDILQLQNEVEGFRTEAVRNGTTRPTRGIDAKRSGHRSRRRHGRRGQGVRRTVKPSAPGGDGRRGQGGQLINQRVRKPKITLLCTRNRTSIEQIERSTRLFPGARWLIMYAHSSNGLANKLGGIRAAYTIARASGRRLLIRWHTGQEDSILQPASPRGSHFDWAANDGPGIAVSPKGAVWDVWGRALWEERRDGLFLSKRPEFLVPKSTYHLNFNSSSLGGVMGQGCAPMLHDVHPRNMDDLEEATAFATLARGAAPLVLMKRLTFDVTHPWTRVSQGAIATNAQAHFKALFRPQSTFLQRVCLHLTQLNLSATRPWIGLQFRRKQTGAVENVQTTTGCPLCGYKTSWLNESGLSWDEKKGVLRGVRCAVRARAASCARGEAAMCGAPVFVTSSSFRVLRYASGLLGADARYTDNPDFVSHGGARNGYLTPLLEMAVLSASHVIVGSAASSYPLEAANFAGTTAIIRDFGMYNVAKELRQATIQGDCAKPFPPGESLLLPHGSCT